MGEIQVESAAALVVQLRADELRSVELNARHDNRSTALKALDERGSAQDLIRKQYAGRYPFELLQNANDAAATGGVVGSVAFILTGSALLVANQGAPFGMDEVRAICGLARSSKDLRKTIGYKGLGFKSIGEISGCPQIFSTDVAFGFNEEIARRDLTVITGELPEGLRIPVYAFPYSLSSAVLGPDEDQLLQLLESHTTVLRLPFDDGVDRAMVEQQLRDSLSPSLLLFLDATESISLSGTAGDFVAIAEREGDGDQIEVLLDVDGDLRHWLVHRRSLEIEDRELLAKMDDHWQVVETVHVGVAIELDPTGRLAVEHEQPLHVYFPTEESSGFPIVVHGDFALELDRRHLARSPEYERYNTWLAEAAGELIATTVGELAARFPGDDRVVAAVAPLSAGTGFGRVIQANTLNHLREVPFIPLHMGGVACSGEVVLLPDMATTAGDAHAFLDTRIEIRLVAPGVERHRRSRELLTTHLAVETLSDAETLELLAEPGHDQDHAFYSLLVAWINGVGLSRARDLLHRVRCVRTHGGGWCAPNEKVLFPRRIETMQLPDGLALPIAELPDVPGLTAILEAAGVRSFEWRFLLPEFVLPHLTQLEVPNDTRQAALLALRNYFETERSGDERLRTQIANVLLDARDAAGRARGRRAAKDLYFGSEWLGHDHLVQIYGPFGEADFLDLPAPMDADVLSIEREFLEWIGVGAHPRVDTCADAVGVGALDRHPHVKYGDWWRSWLTRKDIHAAAYSPPCGHSGQQLRISHSLDRLVALVDRGDRAQLGALWSEIASNWALYESAMTATFYCSHGWHTASDKWRTGPSLMSHVLCNAAWVPSIQADRLIVTQPSRVWRWSRGLPRRVAQTLSLLDPKLSDPASNRLAEEIGVVYAANPTAEAAVALLRQVAAEVDGVVSEDLEHAARWAMRALNDVIVSPPHDGEVPLLARRGTSVVFDSQPWVAEDPSLREVWLPHLPILDGDRDVRHLEDVLGLSRLDDAVRVTADPRGPRYDLVETLTGKFRNRAPHILAYATSERRSSEDDVTRWLSRLRLRPCVDLVLHYSLDGYPTVDRADQVAYISTVIEQQDRLRRYGTAHLEVDPTTNEPHWVAFAKHLARYLDNPNLAAGLSMLLTATAAARHDFLHECGIDDDQVRIAAMRLDQPMNADEETFADLMEKHVAGAVIGVLTEVERATDAETSSHDASRQELVASPSAVPAENGGNAPSTSPHAPASWPAVDMDEIRVHDGVGAPITLPLHGSSAGAVGSGGGRSAPDFVAMNERNALLGRRGESVVYEFERRALIERGQDPDNVRWLSDEYPFSPYDIQSLDPNGAEIYIEVKTTASADPSDAFVISAAEIRFGVMHRDRYHVYRVTEATLQAPVITRFQDPMSRLAEGTAALKLTDAYMALGVALDEAVTDDVSSHE